MSSVTTGELLRRATRLAQQENDLPDYLVERVFAIADCLDVKTSTSPEIDALLEQLPLYDTYAQTGYLGIGVTHLILDKTISQVEQQLGINN